MVDNPDDPRTPKAPEERSGWVSPRIRSKIDLSDEPEPDGSKTANIVAIVMLVGICVLGGFLFVSMKKGQAESKAKAATAAKAAAAAAATDSIAKHQQDSTFAAGQAARDSLAKIEAKKKPPATAGGATAGAAAGGDAATAAPAPPPTKYGIAVGTFLNQERANSEKTKLEASTGLPVLVTPVTEGGVPSFRVVVGQFTSRKDADKKATDLIVGQKVGEAKVIKLPSGG